MSTIIVYPGEEDVKNNTNPYEINLENISHMVREEGHINVFTTNGHTHVSAGKLEKLEEKLAPFGFIKANYLNLVNKKYVEVLICTKSRMALLVNNHIINVSRRKIHQLKSVLQI